MTNKRLWIVLSAGLALLACSFLACGGEEEEEEGGPLMAPGEACLNCHSSGGEASEHVWTAAGTVFTDANGTTGAEGVEVQITDNGGNTVTLTTNSAGNFYTDQALTPPLNIQLSANGNTKSMNDAPNGNCNNCHNPAGQAGEHLVSP
ncbi:MAG: hypothetical protein D6806_09240 [Deltaproteobacteria bacterium]|nr:MAG: hypothetical protein D6806_09240 [Deltaproteobacteria bacterium]